MILSNDKATPTLRLDAKSNVEEPLFDQLHSLGWTVIRLEQMQTPAQSLRASFDQVALLPKFEAALSQTRPQAGVSGGGGNKRSKDITP